MPSAPGYTCISNASAQELFIRRTRVGGNLLCGAAGYRSYEAHEPADGAMKSPSVGLWCSKPDAAGMQCCCQSV
jgi:hypothetical protein